MNEAYEHSVLHFWPFKSTFQVKKTNYTSQKKNPLN